MFFGSLAQRILVQTEPDSPDNPSVSITGLNSLNISCGGVSNATHYRLQRKTEETPFVTVTIAEDLSSYDDEDLDQGETYTYRFQGLNSGLAGPWSPEESKLLPAPPNAPSGLSVVEQGANLHLEWTDNSSDEIQFIVAVKIGAGAYNDLGITDANVVTYDHTPFTEGETYSFKVKAAGVGGYVFSDYCEEVVITP